MADAAPRGRGGFGSRGGDRGRGRGRGRGRRGGAKEEKEWQPVTKLGRLVKAGKITSMEQIYLHSLPIKEYQVVDAFLPKLKDEVMKVRTRIFPGRPANFTKSRMRWECYGISTIKSGMGFFKLDWNFWSEIYIDSLLTV